MLPVTPSPHMGVSLIPITIKQPTGCQQQTQENSQGTVHYKRITLHYLTTFVINANTNLNLDQVKTEINVN